MDRFSFTSTGVHQPTQLHSHEAPLQTDTVPLIRVDSAVKTFTVRSRSLRRVKMIALNNVSLEINRGETVGLVGESGSGKSTLGRSILRLTTLDAGKILYEGQEIQHLSESQFRPLRRKLQMVFQNPLTSFNPMMTIEAALLDSMRLVTELSPSEKKQRVFQLLDQVELSERFAKLYPYEMSGGQLQRAALARALAPDPDDRSPVRLEPQRHGYRIIVWNRHGIHRAQHFRCTRAVRRHEGRKLLQRSF